MPKSVVTPVIDEVEDDSALLGDGNRLGEGEVFAGADVLGDRDGLDEGLGTGLGECEGDGEGRGTGLGEREGDGDGLEAKLADGEVDDGGGVAASAGSVARTPVTSTNRPTPANACSVRCPARQPSDVIDLSERTL